MEAVVTTLRDYSLSFDSDHISQSVARDNLIEEIEELTANQYKLIIIEGSQGVGKTNLLLQFANKHKMNAFGYFINPACNFTYKQDYFMEDIGRQISFYVNGVSVEDESNIEENVYNNLMFTLIKLPKKKNVPLYFIIDGLDQISKTDVDLLKPVLEGLPWETKNFHFLVSGESEKLKEILSTTVIRKAKTFRIPKFNFEETSKFFGLNGNIDNEDIKEMHDTWKGHPDRLNQVRRILDSGVDVKDFLRRDDIKEKNELLEIEWHQASIDSTNFKDVLVKLLCLITFGDNTNDIWRLADMLDSDADSIKKMTINISFLVTRTDDISFVSISYRQFLSNKLRKLEKLTSALMIKYYSEKEGLDSILNLPTLYEKSKAWAGIVDVLTSENIDLVIFNSRSFADISKQINYGYKASKNLTKSYANILKFSLYKSSLREFQKSDKREAQIQACIALSRQDEAFSIISNATIKEDRLKMLIIFSKECKVRSVDVDSSIIEEIKSLIVDIDSTYLRENLIDIVTNLAYFLPDISIQLVVKSAGLKSEKGSFEWLLRYIALIMDSNKDIIGADSIKVFNETKRNGSGLIALKSYFCRWS